MVDFGWGFSACARTWVMRRAVCVPVLRFRLCFAMRGRERAGGREQRRRRARRGMGGRGGLKNQ